MKKPIPYERDEQAAYFKWFALQYPQLVHLLFGNSEGATNYSKCPRCGMVHASVRRLGMLKSQGLLQKNRPDIELLYPCNGYHGMMIELKRLNGTATKEQKVLIKELQSMGYRANACRGFEEAKEMTEEYLKGGDV